MIRVLLVDDEPMFLDLAETYLGRNGTLSISTATSGAEALARLSEEPFDVIVADYEMPVMNGIDLLTRVKAAYPAISFILFTGRGREEVILEALDHGVDFYLEKKDDPEVQFAKLLHKIHRAALRGHSLQKLRENEEKYRSFFDNFQGIAFRGTLDWRPVFLHGAVKAITGYEEKEFLQGRPRWDQIIHPEDRPWLEESIRRFREIPGYSEDREFRIIRKDGEERWLHELIRSVGDDQGRPIAVQGAYYDITEQKEARKTRAFLAAIVESTDDAIVGTDLNGAIISWNEGARRLFQYTADEALGMDAAFLAPGKEQKRIRRLHERIRRGDRIEPLQLQLLGRDGSAVDVSLALSPIIDEHGSPAGTSMIIRDITEQIRAEEALRKSEERFALFAAKSRDVIFRYELRPVARFSFVSPAIRDITGYSPEDYYQDPEFGLRKVYPDDRPILESITRGEIPLGRPISLRWIKRDGSIVWTEERDIPVHDEEGNLVAIEGIIRDITERKVAEEALKDREARLRAIFQAAVHVAFITIDLSGEEYTVTAFSPGAEHIFGYHRDEVIGASAELLLTEDDFERLPEYLAQMKQRKGGYSGELCLVRRSNELFPALFTLYPLRDARGAITAALAVALDITEQKTAEASLRATVQRMEDIIEHLPDPTFVLDPDQRVIAWNRAMEELTESPKDAMIGKNAADVAALIYGTRHPLLIEYIGSKDSALPEDYTAFRREGDTLFVQVFTERLRGGKGAYLSLKASPFYGSDGSLVGAIESIRDITDLKEVEAALRDQTERLSARVGELDSLFRISDCIEEGGALEEVLACIAGCIPSAWHYPDLAGARITLEEKQFVTDTFVESPWTIARPLTVHGTRVGEVAVSYREELPDVDEGPFSKEEGALLSTIANRIRKLIELKKAEDKLRMSEERFNLAIEGAHLGVWDTNVQTGEEYFSDRWAEMLGYSPEELGADVSVWESLVHPDDREAAWESARAHFDGKAPYYKAEFRMKCRDGTWKWIYSQGRVMERDEAGRPLRMTGIHQDITDLRRSREAVREANRKLNLLASITRHDILNQITAALGYLHLAETAEHPEDALRYLPKVQAMVENIQREVEFTRDYHELGVKEPRWQRIDVLATRAAEAVLPEEVTVEVRCGAVEVYADPMLEKVFTNLMDNAMRHGMPLDRIEIAFEETDEGGILSVADNGTGVAAGMKERIFHRAVGLHTGFGLFLTKEILALTGITIRETGREGEGARFEMVVPPGAYRL